MLDERVPMRDGVELATDVVLPEGRPPFPALVFRTPYGRQRIRNSVASAWLRDGYAVVAQDVRGRYASAEVAYEWGGPKEGIDGYDTVEWVAGQAWCSGSVGMAGASYPGSVQWAAALEHPPHLRAIAPAKTRAFFARGRQQSGGATLQALLQSWLIRRVSEDPQLERADTPAVEAVRAAVGTLFPHERYALASPQERARLLDDFPALPEWAAYLPLVDWPPLAALPKAREFWAEMLATGYEPATVRTAQTRPAIDVPALLIAGWWDYSALGQLLNYQELVRTAPTPELARAHRLVVGPWAHMGPPTTAGAWDFCEAAALDAFDLQRRWFDHWLKGQDTGLLEEPPVRLFVMGRNEWREEHEWPLARTQWQIAYFRRGPGFARGLLTTKRPAPEAPPLRFRYDPSNPVPTRGGSVFCWADGPHDQRPSTGELRDDVMSFTSERLEQDLEITGPVQVNLYAATNGTDTDFTGKLIDVWPEGQMFNITDGLLRGRYVESDDPRLMVQGRQYRFEIQLWPTSYVFRRGHQMRVDISCSNFPKYDRNANTGAVPGTDGELRMAQQTIFLESRAPSHIVLPVIPAQ